MQKNWKMTETMANGYSSESTQRDLSNGYQHNRVSMVFKDFCIFLPWMKVASALEGLNHCFSQYSETSQCEHPKNVNTPYREHFSTVPFFLIHFSFLKSAHPLIRTVNAFWERKWSLEPPIVNASVQCSEFLFLKQGLSKLSHTSAPEVSNSAN